MPTGTCVHTGAGDLKAKYVIHAVGPRWDTSLTTFKNCIPLYQAVINTLRMANKLKCKSVAIPAISSGIFGFPKDLCAKIFFDAIEDFVKEIKKDGSKTVLEEVRLTNFDEETTSIF